MKWMIGVIGIAYASIGSVAVAQGQPPVVSMETHDSEIVFVTVTNLMACGTPPSKFGGIGPRFQNWMNHNTIGGRPAAESYMARFRKAAQAYSNPQAKAMLCSRADLGKARMMADANSAMTRLESEHAHAHGG